MRKNYSLKLYNFYKRFFTRHVLLFLFILVSGLFISFNKKKPESFEPIRISVFEITAPILEILAQPVVLTNKAFQKIHDFINHQTELDRVREENTKLLKWQAIAKKLKYENKVLRKLIKLAPFPKLYFITAQVIASSGGSFSHSIMINAGSQHGIEKGQAVVTHRGLVGRVVEVGEDASRVLLVTDINMRVPAVLESTRARTIVGGNNSDLLDALYLPVNEKIQVGDRVVTSFEGGIFPPNIVVGRIVSTLGDVVKIKSLVKWHRLEFVQVIQQKPIKGIQAHERKP